MHYASYILIVYYTLSDLFYFNVYILTDGPENIRFTPTSSNITVIENESRNITCSADCNPPPCNINWYKGSETSGNIISSSNGRLQLNNIQRQDTTYTCQAKHRNLTTTPLTKTLQITVYYGPENVIVTPTSSSITVIENESRTVTCSADCNPPPCNISWYKGADTSSNIISSSNGLLQLNNIQRPQAGNYTCQAKHTQISGSQSKQLMVIVHYPPTITSLTSDATNNMVDEHSTVTFTCSVDSLPSSVISWSRSQQEEQLYSGSQYTISKASCQHTDNYTCTASNNIGQPVSKHIPLYARCSPRENIETKRNIINRIDATINLEVDIIAYPEPTFTWYHTPTRQIINTARTQQLSTINYKSTVEITLNSTLFGDYIVSVHNGIGIQNFTITVIDGDICPETIIISNHTGVEVEYRMPETIHGQTFETDEICVVDGAPIGVIRCFNGSWSRIAFNENCNFQESLKSAVTTNLSVIAQSNLTHNFETNLVKVQYLTSIADELTPLDVIYTAIMLEGISKTDNITQQGVTNFINIINNIQNSKEQVVTEANVKVNISNRLIASLDELELRIPTDDDDGHFRLVTNETVVEVWNLTRLKRNPVLGLSIDVEGSNPVDIFENNVLSTLYEESEVIYKRTDVGILLNKQFVTPTIEEKTTTDIRLSMHMLNTDNLFITDNNDTVNSKVISATLTIDRKPVVNLNGSFVTIVFFPQKILQDKYKEKYSHCVFWDFSLNNFRGGWSNDGCRYVNTAEGRDVCVCDHLTNFALLLDYYGHDFLVQPSHQQALSIITYIGLILSIIGLGLTILTFLVFKKLREGRPQQVMFNLALAMLSSWIVFLTGIKQTGDHVGCIVVAVLLHYFIMASFTWMLMEGILQYLLFVKVLGSHFRHFMLKATILAWGLPVIPVASMLAIDVKLYNGGELYCWMGLKGMYYGFALPLGLIILTNSIIHILVTHSICNRNNLNTTVLQHSVTNIRASFCSFIFLGLTWVFGFLAISDARLVFQYIFTVLNSLQGFLIFILFTARDKKVRDYWKQLCWSCKTRSTTSKSSKTTSSSTAL
ncbi:adhesion G-protein coupled receptor G6 isoform X2 [Patella vulgata]|uniref:adhesion G-protein coupled receptor G6 isoform X2 n=1 Tax=Patella vulgata TaxID=6465 RepID=UPI0024A8454A|nr:adhesion G-protein coupled receptor G6 isoform X2 [Patella vulgata]